MIDPNKPDYTNTPVSSSRPRYSYVSRGDVAPEVSIVMPYYNMGSLFGETVECIRRISFANWECLVIDDGSTNAESLRQLEEAAACEPRIRVIHQPNGGPGVARNTAFAHARGRYLFQLDSDDLIEPTFVEKAVWFLETQSQFAACGSWVVGFGAKEYVWRRGFDQYERVIDENSITNMVLIRREAWAAVGGYDPAVSYEHADWDFWLNLAEVGQWGHSLSEPLAWYRAQEKSLLVDIEGNKERAQAFRCWLLAKHGSLRERFPRPTWMRSVDIPYARIADEIPVRNALAKPDGTKRILMLLPWLEIGGADKFNRDMIEQLAQRGYEFTIATTVAADDTWKPFFTALTPDVFNLHQFLNRADYPRFLTYLIESRQIDAVILSNSELGYLLLPYLRAHYPHLPMLDFNHLEEEHWKDGGYPAAGVRVGRQLDLHVTCTEHLKRWMVGRGEDAERIDVVHCNVDTAAWDPSRYDAAAVRERLEIDPGIPLVLFVGRMVDQKRPLLFAQIVRELAARNPDVLALVIGTGPQLDEVKAYVDQHGLQRQVRCLGALPSEEVRELMAAADILLLPSEREGLALVLYEAMAMGVVPVAADVGGHAELVTPECGYLIAKGEGELDAYLAALVALLEAPEQRRQMAVEARRRVVESFDLRRMGDGMEQAIARATRLAAQCPAPPVDLTLGRHTAHLAVEYTRISEAADILWAERRAVAVSGDFGDSGDLSASDEAGDLDGTGDPGDTSDSETGDPDGADLEQIPSVPSVGFKRRLQQTLLPWGSPRHEAYKRVRAAVLELRPARLLAGTARQVLRPPALPPATQAPEDGKTSAENTGEPEAAETGEPAHEDALQPTRMSL